MSNSKHTKRCYCKLVDQSNVVMIKLFFFFKGLARRLSIYTDLLNIYIDLIDLLSSFTTGFNFWNPHITGPHRLMYSSAWSPESETI